VAVVIHRRKADRPYRVIDGDRPLTGWVKTWGYAVRVAEQHDWTGEVVDVTGDAAADAPLVTRHGHRMDEAASALQKEIRRGNEPAALYWACELASRYPWKTWRRLVVIACEDVGLADPMAIVVVEALRSSYCWAAEGGRGRPGWNQLMGMAVMYLARAPKSRTVDLATWGTQEYVRIVAPPDYAVDMHTARGKQRGRGIAHFLAEGGRLEGEVDVGGTDWRWVEDRWEAADG
jgi:replication-associated recombination protein RarA